MAITRTQLGSQRVRPLHGRNGCLDNNYLVVGPNGMRTPVTEYTSASSTATALPGYGRHSFQLSTLSTQDFQLGNPVPGAEVTIAQRLFEASTPLSTGFNLKRSSTAFYITASEGTTMTTINMSSAGFITLLGLTTDRYLVVGRSPRTTGSTGYGPVLNGTT